jgi:hypothetical protein
MWRESKIRFVQLIIDICKDRHQDDRNALQISKQMPRFPIMTKGKEQLETCLKAQIQLFEGMVRERELLQVLHLRGVLEQKLPEFEAFLVEAFRIIKGGFGNG